MPTRSFHRSAKNTGDASWSAAAKEEGVFEVELYLSGQCLRRNWVLHGLGNKRKLLVHSTVSFTGCQ